MKTSMINKYAMLALLGTSFIALNNCGSQSDSTVDPALKDLNGQASDYAATLGYPIGGYAVVPGTILPTESMETTCSDGSDNDGDGYVDCMDIDCAIHPECSEFGPPYENITNSRALTVYPNGALVPEDLAIMKRRPATDFDYYDGWARTPMFLPRVTDCWVRPVVQDPYYSVDFGAPLVAGPSGGIGPQVSTDPWIPLNRAYGPNVAGVISNPIGPRAGLINECDQDVDIFTYHFNDDDGDDDEGNWGAIQ